MSATFCAGACLTAEFPPLSTLQTAHAAALYRLAWAQALDRRALLLPQYEVRLYGVCFIQGGV
jgi:hypothetical protein